MRQGYAVALGRKKLHCLFNHSASNFFAKFQVLNKSDERPVPDEPKVVEFIQNLRKRMRELAKAPSPADWNLADFELLCNTLPGLAAAEAQGQGLALVASHLEDDHLVVSLCNVALVKRYWSLLTNQNFVKLCTDGIYRLSSQRFAVVSVGILCKKLGGGQKWKESEDSQHCFPTSFKELMLSIVSSEHHTTYRRVFEDLDHAMLQLNGVEDFWSRVGQVHGDFHAGLIQARSDHYRPAEQWASSLIFFEQYPT